METIGRAYIEYKLQDESKELSKDNKILESSIKPVFKCSCGNIIDLSNEHLIDRYGYEFICPKCNKKHHLNEEAFDSFFDYYYEEDLIFEDESEDEDW